MADYNTFNNLDEILSQPGRISVITTDWCNASNFISDGIEIVDYEDGKEVQGSEQYFDLVSPDDSILNAQLQKNVFVEKEAEGFFEEKLKQAQDFRDANGNLDVYADRLEKRILEEEEADSEDNEY